MISIISYEKPMSSIGLCHFVFRCWDISSEEANLRIVRGRIGGGVYKEVKRKTKRLEKNKQLFLVSIR